MPPTFAVGGRKYHSAPPRFYSTDGTGRYTGIKKLLPRARRPPRRIDSDGEPHIFETPLEYYRKTYFEVIDVVVNELVRRFDQASLKIPLANERLLLQAANLDIPGSIEIDKDLLSWRRKKSTTRNKLRLPPVLYSRPLLFRPPRFIDLP